MVTKLDTLHERINKLEEKNNQEVLTLIEILSNLSFFGDIKKQECEHAKKGQCTYFILKKEQEYTIPIISKCRIKDCKELPTHYHIETSNITCGLCLRQTDVFPTKEVIKINIRKK